MDAKASDTKQTTKARTEFTPKRKAQLTFPLLKMVNDGTVFFKITSAFERAKEIKQKEGTKPADVKQPPMLAQGVDLSTGESCQIIVNAILQSTLEELYPDQKYVGKSFEITKRKKEDGKAYNKFEIYELED